ncbi:MAG: DEAD/DEAH box helicase [Desulfobacteraceae bacterium]|nr:DEAD/DEAH box helicase [Desulfobacteraceae bacterium]
MKIGFPVIIKNLQECCAVWIFTCAPGGGNKKTVLWNEEPLSTEDPFGNKEPLNRVVREIMTQRSIVFECDKSDKSPKCKECDFMPQQNETFGGRYVSIEGSSYGLALELASRYHLSDMKNIDFDFLLTGAVNEKGKKPVPLSDPELLKKKGEFAVDKGYTLILHKEDYDMLDEDSGWLVSSKHDFSKLPESIESLEKNRAYILPTDSFGKWEYSSGKSWTEGLGEFLGLTPVTIIPVTSEKSNSSVEDDEDERTERDDETIENDLIEISEETNSALEENHPTTSEEESHPSIEADEDEETEGDSLSEGEYDMPEALNEDENLIPETEPQILVKNLWEDAFKDKSLDFITDEAEIFLNTIEQSENSIFDKKLTDLQSELWKSCQKSREDNYPQYHPFHSERNVLLSAPTSSGKTAVAEIFLFLPTFYSERSRSAVYLAPTRSLAQTKYREFVSRYGNCLDPNTDEPLADQIIISTGEDTIHDSRLAKGKFIIACLVYEKANIIFSQSKGIINQIGCVVIDELHMLQQIQRGPVLEILIAKICHEQQGRGTGKDNLKIVGISTEGEPPEALRKFFNFIRGDIYPPIEISVTSRPVPIRHHFILPPTDKDKDFTPCLIGEFNDRKDRVLSQSDRKLLRTQLKDIWTQFRRNIGNVPNEFIERTMNLIKSLIEERENGYRLLVFVPTKNEALKFADRIMPMIISLGVKPGETVDYEKFIQLSEEAEGEDLIPKLREFASYGIFLHHADIDRNIRSFIEEHFELPGTEDNEAPQVIIATQTLSYGVNLVLHDVIILATNDYPTSDRNGKFEKVGLNVCDFHNMAGRAGRLGKITSRDYANVYVVPNQEVGNLVGNLVNKYYNTPPHIESKLFLSEDSREYWQSLNHGKRNIYQILKVEDYTYPFARTVLDALRHLTSKYSSARVSPAATPQELQRRILSNSLYYCEKVVDGKSEFPNDFDSCMRAVLWACSSNDYKLVKKIGEDEERYTITQLGEAIINTGTDLKTVAPMLKHTIAFYKIWKTYFKNKEFSVYLYVLVVIAQEEIFLRKVLETPEGKTIGRQWEQEMIEKNRRNVRKNFQQLIGKKISAQKDILDKFVNEITQYLDKELLAPKSGTGDIGYPEGFTDVVLRFFCAVIKWIDMADERVVKNHVQEYRGPTSSGRQMHGALTGFRQFTDQVSWKLLFLWNLNNQWSREGEDKLPSLQVEQEIELHNIVAQIRIGCTAPGIALSYPTSSNFSRIRIRGMLNDNITPTCCCLLKILRNMSEVIVI